jgi:hypothetical protein
MKTFQLGPGLGPGHVGLHLCHPYQEQCEPAKHNMGADAIRPGVVDRSEGQGRLQGPEGLLNFHELLIPQGNILGRQTLVTGTQKIFAIKFFRLPDLGLIHCQLTGLQFFEIPAHGSVGQKRIFGFEMRFSGLLFQDFEFDLDPFQIFSMIGQAEKIIRLDNMSFLNDNLKHDI